MKRFTALILGLILIISALTACVSIDMGDISDESSEQSKTPAASNDSSEETTQQPSSEETSEVLAYAPIYPENYAERTAYYANLPIEADVNDGYFDDSVFVGNSIMLHYKNYVADKRVALPDLLGNAKFFAAASFSLYNNKHQKPTDKDCALPVYRGEKLNIMQAVEAMEAKTVYLSLMALNDIALYKDGETGVNETFELFKELVADLKESFPNINIVVMSNTYLHKSSSGMKKLNNTTVNNLNNKVLEYCNANGYDYIDVTQVLVDTEGCLGTEFCSDVGASVSCHLNSTAYNAWTEILRDYAEKKAADRWVNPTIA